MASDSTQAVLEHHFQSVTAHDVDAIMEDFTDNSVVLTPDATVRGLAELRSYFTEFVKLLTPELIADFKLAKQEIHDDVAYLAWSMGDAVPMGTDTFVITDGKIRVQTVTEYRPG